MFQNWKKPIVVPEFCSVFFCVVKWTTWLGQGVKACGNKPIVKTETNIFLFYLISEIEWLVWVEELGKVQLQTLGV